MEIRRNKVIYIIIFDVASPAGGKIGLGGWKELIDIKTHTHSYRCVCARHTKMCNNNVKRIEDEFT